MSHTPTECGMCHRPDCERCYPPMSLQEFLAKLDERKAVEAHIRRNPSEALGWVKSLVAERDALRNERDTYAAYLAATAEALEKAGGFDKTVDRLRALLEAK